MNNVEIKVGLYIQEFEPSNKRENEKVKNQFYKTIENVKDSDIDLLVFPETSFVPNDFPSTDVEEIALAISEMVGKAVIVGFETSDEMVCSVFANAFYREGETRTAIYYKHIFTQCSPFDMEDYESIIDNYFPVIDFKGLKLGMTICYDLTQSIFSRKYGRDGVDIVINTTGSDVNIRKWSAYLKTRAIENNCYALCVDGYSLIKKQRGKTEQGMIALGYNSKGQRLSSKSLKTNKEVLSDEFEKDEVYVIDFSVSKNTDSGKVLPQNATVPKFEDIKLPADNIQEYLDDCKKLEDGLYVKKKTAGGVSFSLVFCVVNGDEILKPECVLSKLYSNALDAYKNRRYIVVCKYADCGKTYFDDIIAPIIVSRTSENYVSLIFESKLRNLCLQVTRTKNVQLVESVRGKYSLDLDRAKGPDLLWKKRDTIKMCSDWKENFIKLLASLNE